MGRLNDTAALRGPSSCCDISVSTRKIDNGYIKSTSSYNQKTGAFKSSEEFVTRPSDEPDRGAVGNEGLGDTKRYLGDDV